MLNKNKKLILLIIFLFFILSGCSTKKDIVKNNKIKIAATIFPLFDIVQIVGGEKIDPILILSPGASPHTYSATPKKIKEIQGTKIIFGIGLGVDNWVTNIANTVSGVEIINLDKNISLKYFKDQDNSRENIVDPHYWLSPANAETIAKQIALELSKIDRVNQEYYQSQVEQFISKLKIKDIEWKSKISKLENKNLIMFHDAWGYFADYFGLNIVATFEPFPGKTPSPKYLVNLQKEIKKYNIKTIFVEPQLSKEAIQTMADDLGVSIKTLDPLGGFDKRNSYLDLIDFNIKSMTIKKIN